MKIGQLAERTGVTAKTIRYYESIGLVPEPERTTSNYRDYGDDVAARLQFIRDSQAAGLSLAEVGSILELKDAGEPTCEHTHALVRRHIEVIDAQMKALRENRAVMVALADAAGHMIPGECSDPQRCQVISVAAADGADAPGGRTRIELHPHH